MRILFIADPLEHFKIYKDTTFAMMEEAHRRGHALSFAEARQLSVEGGRLQVDACDLAITEDRQNWYKLGQKLRQPLTAFSSVVMRKDPPFDMEYLYASQMFSLAEEQG
ncbi:glutathione synthase, partial [Klebsiella pneumoniae]|nr:glutathione synthase [Klebsiella pneumoniae]